MKNLLINTTSYHKKATLSFLALILLLIAAFSALPTAAKSCDDYLRDARAGNVEAQYYMGNAYLFGTCVERDPSVAATWFQKAADQGHAGAQNNLGRLYEDGNGVHQDYEKAAQLYTLSANQGNAAAQDNLGWFYENGFSVKKDYDEAAKWYIAASEQGLYGAMNDLGSLGSRFIHGDGVPQDFDKGFEWVKIAAENGLTVAANEIGGLYKEGSGVKKDYMQAGIWYEKAADATIEEGNYYFAQGDLQSAAYCFDQIEYYFLKAKECYQLAANAGNSDAAKALAKIIEKGY